MSNQKISITAEFVSLIKSNENPRYEYFISKRTRNMYLILSKIFSKKRIQNIFQKRIEMSKEFDRILEKNKFDCVVELGGGFSLRGFEHALKNKKIHFIDTDFLNVTFVKNKIIQKICKDEKITFPKNYFLLPIDVLNDNLSQILDKKLKKTNLILAEGLTPYFNKEDYSKFISNLKPILSNKNNTFFSQENFEKKQTLTYKIIRKFVSIIIKNKSHIKFKTKDELVEFLKQKKIKNIKAYYKNNALFYKIN